LTVLNLAVLFLTLIFSFFVRAVAVVGGCGCGGGCVWYNVSMPKDWITFKLSELDPSLLKVLSDWSGGRDVRNSHNALELARLFVLWFLFKLKRLPVILKYVVPSVPKEVKEVTVEHLKALLGVPEKKSVVVCAPRYRAFRKGYYAWVKHLDLPKVNWVLITLTLSRDIALQDAWARISKFVSDFLHRFRVYLRKVKRFTEFHYLGVIEPHEDGYPHVHILASFPFVDVQQIFNWWKSEGGHLSAFQGVDVEFIGHDVERVKSYVLKYLVKNHGKYWQFCVRGDEVTVRLSTLFMWYFRVPLLFMSRSIRALARAVRSRFRAHLENSGEFGVFVGISDFWHVWRLLYKPLKIPLSEFFLGFIDCGGVERSWVHVYSLLVERYAKI
jgi:hypothetical protein